MNQHLQSIVKFIEQDKSLPADEKIFLLKSLKDADKELEITAFKLDQAEKVKRTTAVLLEETIEELEQKRKAVEVQNKELEIESSLERVRTMAMSMRKPDDLLEICEVLFAELRTLGFTELRNTMINIHDDDKGSFLNYDYSGNAGKTITNLFYNTHPVIEKQVNQARSSNDAFSEAIFTGKDLDDWKEFRKRNGEPDDPKVDSIDSLFYYFYSIGTGVIGISTYSSITEEKRSVLKRFRNVFDLAYRRFLDIEQAEAQAKEAKIEAALERVRSKAMAMHKPDDLNMAVATVFEELDKLNPGMLRCGIAILDKEKPRGDIWITVKSEEGNTIQVSGDESLDTHVLLKGAYAAWLKQEEFSYVLKGEDLAGYYEAATKTNFQSPISARFDAEKKDQQQYYFNSVFQDGSLFAFLEAPITDETKMVMRRFAAVFNLTYKRFLDLQKAEANAREAQIEASLERVRAHAMAMHNSTDLSSTVNIFFKELKTLGIAPMRCGVGEMHEVTHTSDLVFTTADKQGELYELPGKLKHEGHPVVENIYNYWKRQEEYHPVLQGADINAYYRVIKSQMVLPDFPDYTIHYGNYFYFKEGFFFAWAEKEFTEEAMNIFRRFTSVLSLTYKRYKDLKQAEANAREAKIETALEKVRSRTLAMQKSEELAETAAVVFNQLIGLGIAPNRLYIGIVKDESGEIEYWITDEDGSKVSQQFTGNANRNESVQKIFTGWKAKQKSVTLDMQGEELKNYFHYLADDLNVPFKGGLSQKRRVQTIAYFSKGFIGIASPDEQPGETTKLLERFAAVFNLTFTRFNDLKIAEAHAEQAELDLLKLKEEKKRTEDALAELQVTQKQLIQSEKMASLGELTAGIAHEIQNPLNFVNNFSEVSNELIDEMMEEVAKGNYDEVKALVNDVKQNLQKINHHGKRADGIVKGMLQHSRSSSGVKEPTDINKLADEYLHLAYHGLRAKDKLFNATLKTDYDESIGNVNIIPQDIGRAILNLITNAFYAVTERKKQAGDEYEPVVSVTTRKIGEKVFLSVKDNGNGIPQKVLDKIFQPFFTTKPTGQGTGLGLSLSYDIVKAHGGEIKVETADGQGTTFIIELKST